MAARKKANKKEPERLICDNCALAEWVTHLQRHLDLNGKPICLTCPHEKYFIVRGHKACSHYVGKK